MTVTDVPSWGAFNLSFQAKQLAFKATHMPGEDNLISLLMRVFLKPTRKTQP